MAIRAKKAIRHYVFVGTGKTACGRDTTKLFTTAERDYTTCKTCRRNTQKVYMMTQDLIGDGEYFFDKFTFHAENDAQAQDKSFGWARYHSFDARDVKAREATAEEIAKTGWLHDEWVD